MTKRDSKESNADAVLNSLMTTFWIMLLSSPSSMLREFSKHPSDHNFIGRKSGKNIKIHKGTRRQNYHRYNHTI